jgi:hypothetical protein
MAKDSLEPSASTLGTQDKRLRNVYLTFLAFPLLPKPEPRTVGHVCLIGILLGSLVRLTSTKSVWSCGAKLRFGFAQVIPRGSWLQRVCIEQSFGFLSFVQALHVV